MDERNNLARGAYEWLDTLATCFAFLMLVFFFVVKTYTVSGDSMYPTLEDGSSMLVLSAAYSPEQGDIVVLEHAGGADRSLVKRVVATGGQTVHIDDSGLLTVDGAIAGIREQASIADKMLTGLPTTTPDALVSDILPLAAETRFPISVIDENGTFVGLVTKASVLSCFVDSPDSVEKTGEAS